MSSIAGEMVDRSLPLTGELPPLVQQTDGESQHPEARAGERRGSLGAREVRVQPQNPYTDPWWKVALSCFPIIGSIMQLVNNAATGPKCQDLYKAGKHQEFAQALEQRNRHRIYAIVSAGLVAVAAIVLIALSILSPFGAIGIAAIAAGIALNAYRFHQNKQLIDLMRSDRPKPFMLEFY
jgi:hypothetical protein